MDAEISMNQEFLEKLNNLIEHNLENENFGVEELAEAIGKSRSQLHRKLNAINGKSTSQFIREYRLEKAKKMLQNNVATASEIAYKVGFGSPSYFNTCFHDFYGYPPGEVKFRNPLINEEKKDREPLIENSNTITIKRWLHDLKTYIIGALVLILVVSFSYYKLTHSDETLISEKENTNPIDFSIAVLPFINKSEITDNDAFSDGITNILISKLSKINGISKVISLTSRLNYKDKYKSMPEIAKELNVHYVLESEFQKSGNNIKINLQLIDGPNDKLLWSEEYLGSWDDGEIFKIQSKVAEAIAKHMNVKIKEKERMDIRKTLTDNTEAYDNYLKGIQFFTYNNSAKNLVASRPYFETAIALDSTFIEAYLNLGLTYSLMGTWGGTMTKRVADSLADPYIKKAIQLDPNNLDVMEAIANKEFSNWNFIFTDSMYKIIRNKRGDHFYSSFIELTQGRYDQVIKRGTNVLKRYPIRGSFYPLTYGYYHKGEIDSTLYMINNILLNDPNSDRSCEHMGNILLALKEYERARDVLETGLQVSSKRYASMVVHLSLVYHYLGDEKKSLELLNEVIDRANKGEPEINVYVAHYYARLGNNDEAFKWLDIAYAKHEADLIWLKADPNLNLLKNDSRYKKLLKNIGFLDVK